MKFVRLMNSKGRFNLTDRLQKNIMTNGKRILISGTSSGLGKYLSTQFSSDTFDRTASSVPSPEAPYDAIFHCAFNTGRTIAASDFDAYVADTIGLTQTLLNIPHRTFVFISSVDVYPAADAPHTEGEDFVADNIDTLYGLMKFTCESLVRNATDRHLILRETALLGPTMRKNSLMKILTDDTPPTLGLSSDSSFNYILYSDIEALIRTCLDKGATGTMNMASSSNVTLQAICDRFHKTAQFGNFTYQTGHIDNSKAAALCPGLKRSSLETVGIFLEQIGQLAKAA